MTKKKTKTPTAEQTDINQMTTEQLIKHVESKAKGSPYEKEINTALKRIKKIIK